MNVQKQRERIDVIWVSEPLNIGIDIELVLCSCDAMWKAEKQRNEKYTIIKKNMFIGNSQNDQKQEKERICVKLSIFCVRACVRGYFNSPMFGERIMCVSYVSIGNKLENSALSKSALSYRI